MTHPVKVISVRLRLAIHEGEKEKNQQLFFRCPKYNLSRHRDPPSKSVILKVTCDPKQKRLFGNTKRKSLFNMTVVVTHIGTCFSYPNNNVSLVIPKASQFSIWRSLSHILALALKTKSKSFINMTLLFWHRCQTSLKKRHIWKIGLLLGCQNNRFCLVTK